MKHIVITAPSEIEQLAHAILDGAVTDNVLYPRSDWEAAARDAADGDPTDLAAFLSETDDWRNDWHQPRAAESYVPISLERPCAALHGAWR